MIQRITIVTQTGVDQFRIGMFSGENEVTEIKKVALHFTGDPFDHYCGYNKKGEMLFSINCLCPCVIEYKP